MRVVVCFSTLLKCSGNLNFRHPSKQGPVLFLLSNINARACSVLSYCIMISTKITCSATYFILFSPRRQIRNWYRLVFCLLMKNFSINFYITLK